MKKWILMSITAIVLLCMSAQVLAAENTVSITDGAGEPGKTVFLTVSLNQSVMGDMLAISYDYDSNLLTAIRGSCKWERSSLLSDFDDKMNGVWAISAAEDLKGDICTLAFRINTGASFESTKVSCTVVVRSGNQDVGTYTASAMVSMSCSHSTYGDWVRRDDLIHTSTCSQCGNVQSGTHKWDAGEEAPNPDEPLSTLVTLTCEVCKATKTIVVADSLSEPDGTKPQETEPNDSNNGNTGATKPQEPECTDPSHDHSNDTEWDDDHTHDSPSQDSGSQNQPDREEDPTDSHEEICTDPSHDHDHDHDHGQVTTTPNQDTHEEDDHSGHDHSHDEDTTESDNTNRITGIVILLVAGGLVAAGVFFVMKKK